MALIIISLLSVLFAGIYFVALLWFRAGWSKLQLPPVRVPAFNTSVSIIIAARNEEDKIGSTIDDILKQQYPASLVELIVIDDHSTDNTSGIVAGYASTGVKLIQLKEAKALNSYKKKAIAEAIAIASGELIITTDADCRMGADWLSTIVSMYQSGDYKLISSPVMFFEEKSFFERIQTLEFLYLIGLGAATIGNQQPSTCNGANLAYRRDTFQELGGFKGIDDLASGDDELLLHKVAARYPRNIGFCKSYKAMVYTHAKPTIREFIQQRRRWASKSTKYKNRRIVALGVGIWLFNLTIVISILFAFQSLQFLMLLVSVLIIKGLAELVFLVPVTGFAKSRRLLYYLPLLTFIHSIYIVYIGVAGNSGKYVWKGRLVK